MMEAIRTFASESKEEYASMIADIKKLHEKHGDFQFSPTRQDGYSESWAA